MSTVEDTSVISDDKSVIFYIGGLSYFCSDKDIRNLLSVYGEIIAVTIVRRESSFDFREGVEVNRQQYNDILYARVKIHFVEILGHNNNECTVEHTFDNLHRTINGKSFMGRKLT